MFVQINLIIPLQITENREKVFTSSYIYPKSNNQSSNRQVTWAGRKQYSIIYANYDRHLESLFEREKKLLKRTELFIEALEARNCAIIAKMSN